MQKFVPITIDQIDLSSQVQSTVYDEILRQTFLSGPVKGRKNAALAIELEEGETSRGVNARVRHAARRLGLEGINVISADGVLSVWIDKDRARRSSDSIVDPDGATDSDDSI